MSVRPSLLVTRRLPQAVEEHFRTQYEVTFNDDDTPLDRTALGKAMRDYDAICPTITDRFDGELITTPGRRVQILGNFGAGIDHIDLAAAKAAGIVVTNTPDALTDSTADVAILLILMAARRAGEGERELRAKDWTGWRPVHLLGQSVTGKTLGLVGFGRIAQAVAVRAAALGMRILYHSRSPASSDVESRLGASRAASLPALMQQADVVSLHVPGGTETRHLVDGAMLEQMKPTAILVNTALGTVVDEAALADALAARRIASAGLDVYEREPAVEPALLELENVVLLPHLGSATIETRTAMGMQAAANLDAFFAGREPPNRVA